MASDHSGMAPMCETRPKRKTRLPFLLCCFVCLDQVESWVVGGFAQGESGGVGL